MKLKYTQLHGDPAWLWIAPNGTPKWVWYRGEHDAISSQMFETLDALKDHLAQVFGSEDCMPYLYAKNEARPTVDSMFAEYIVINLASQEG